MLKVFQNNKSGKNTPRILNVITFLMIWVVGITVITLKSTDEGNMHSYILELNENDSRDIEALVKKLKAQPLIKKASLKFVPKEQAATVNELSIADNLFSYLIKENVITDIISFSTISDITQDQVVSLTKYVDGQSSVNQTFPTQIKSKQVHAGITGKANFSPFLIIAFVILLFFAIALLRNDLKKHISEIKMLSLSGVSDPFIVSKLTSSVNIGVINAWFASVLLFLGSFYLIKQGYSETYLNLSIQDNIVALTIPLVLLLIVCSAYTKQWAKQILNRI